MSSKISSDNEIIIYLTEVAYNDLPLGPSSKYFDGVCLGPWDPCQYSYNYLVKIGPHLTPVGGPTPERSQTPSR